MGPQDALSLEMLSGVVIPVLRITRSMIVTVVNPINRSFAHRGTKFLENSLQFLLVDVADG